MQWTDVQANWVAYTPVILAQWPILKESDVLAIGGDMNGFMDHLAAAKGGDAVAAQMEVADWLMNSDPLSDVA